MSAHKYVHIELSARDRAESARFYTAVFGWTFTDFPEMNYTSTGQEVEVGTGLNNISESQPAGTITPYIHTDNLADTVARVRANGGEILLESMDIPGVGTMALFKDSTGNMLGLLQPAAM
jgi:predicted enzyme related to lactoylglutathione lyase